MNDRSRYSGHRRSDKIPEMGEWLRVDHFTSESPIMGSRWYLMRQIPAGATSIGHLTEDPGAALVQVVAWNRLDIVVWAPVELPDHGLLKCCECERSMAHHTQRRNCGPGPGRCNPAIDTREYAGYDNWTYPDRYAGILHRQELQRATVERACVWYVLGPKGSRIVTRCWCGEPDFETLSSDDAFHGRVAPAIRALRSRASEHHSKHHTGVLFVFKRLVGSAAAEEWRWDGDPRDDCPSCQSQPVLLGEADCIIHDGAPDDPRYCEESDRITDDQLSQLMEMD